MRTVDDVTATRAVAPDFRPGDVIAFLSELRELSGGPAARRLAWSAGWREARALLRTRLTALPVQVEEDIAGNVWARLEGDRSDTLVVGSHLDAVPDGGWLDGTLGVAAGLALIEAAARTGERPPVSLALVDWADEEGVRFGQALFGSAAITGALDLARLRASTDSDGRRATDVLAEHGVELDALNADDDRLADAFGYLELHIEQGSVLDSEGLPVAAVNATAAVRRVPAEVLGRSEHVGPAALEARRDAMLTVARLAVAAHNIAADHHGRSAVTVVELTPNLPTVIAGRARASIDLRHADDEGVSAMLDALHVESRAISATTGCRIDIGKPTFEAAAGRFDERLVASAAETARRLGGRDEPMLSGALHDATNISRRVPTAMLFCRSLSGLSHCPEEDSSEADLLTAASAFAETADMIIRRHLQIVGT
jgi:N-carbamoyl-L-amino-acid hydrolase